jgi:mRNA interferase HigB
MLLLNVPALDRFTRKHRDAAHWIAEWRVAVERAEWQCLDDVRTMYSSADGVKVRSGAIVTIFNVKGNEYRLLTSILYQRQLVYVLEGMTHAEYSRNQWKKRL